MIHETFYVIFAFEIFCEIARARSGAMWQMVRIMGLREPNHTHYSPHYGDNGGKQKPHKKHWDSGWVAENLLKVLLKASHIKE